jgi:hypothetical protein
MTGVPGDPTRAGDIVARAAPPDSSPLVILPPLCIALFPQTFFSKIGQTLRDGVRPMRQVARLYFRCCLQADCAPQHRIFVRMRKTFIFHFLHRAGNDRAFRCPNDRISLFGGCTDK